MQNSIYGSFEGRRIGFANRRRGVCRPLWPARPAPAQRNQASESILDEERGRAAAPLPLKGLTPLTKIGSANASIPLLIPHKKNEPPAMEVRQYFRSSFQKNRGFPIWRNAFGAKNGAQAKQRVEAYLTYARVFVIAQQLVFSSKSIRQITPAGTRTPINGTGNRCSIH